MVQGNTFYETAVILSLAAVLGVLGQKLRQPLIIMFLATGILAGPAVLGVIHSHEQIALLAQIGISLLLFIVGLRLDLSLIRTTGPVALATGLGQIVFTAGIGFVICLGLGMNAISSAYVSVALTFSSTIIIVKLLSDKKEIDALHGRIAVGFLIVQDIAAILALVALTTFGSKLTEGQSALGSSLMMAGKGIGLLLARGAADAIRAAPPDASAGPFQEMLILFAVAWAVLLAAASEWLGFSKEVGAFLAGVSLASSEYRDSISSKLTSIRDFLLLFFFIDLGPGWNGPPSDRRSARRRSCRCSCSSAIPLIVIAIMGYMGYRRRTGFLAGLTVAQISEFSLIVGALGVHPGPHHAGDDGSDHPRRRRDDLRVHLHDPLLAEPLPGFRRAAEDLRAQEPVPRGQQRHRRRDDGRRCRSSWAWATTAAGWPSGCSNARCGSSAWTSTRRSSNDGGPGASRSSTATSPTPISTSSCP